MRRLSVVSGAFALLLVVALVAAPGSSAVAAQSSPVFTKKPRPSTTALAAAAPSQEMRQFRVEALRTDDETAKDIRNRLTSLLRQYPPSLSEVLRLDPSLLSNEAYLKPYPALATFLGQHPEIAH